MRHLWLLVGLLTLIGSGAAQAASYQMIDGTIVNPIKNTYGGDSSYSGSNLEPGANLPDVDLSDALLYVAELHSADLTGASLEGADLQLATLSDATLTAANLSGARLSWADLSNANLTNAWLYSANLDVAEYWSTATWTGAKYSLNAVDNNGNPIADTIFPAGMDQAWRDAAGMVAVPEPTTALLLGLVGLSIVRWNLTPRHL